MGLTKRVQSKQGSIPCTGRNILLHLFFPLLLFNFIPVFAQQNPVSLAAEISRLEKLGAGAASRTERLDAYAGLIRLHQLSGDSEAALKTCESALAAFPNEASFLLEQGRILISMGEFEKASSPLSAIKQSDNKELSKQARLLAAKLEAFASDSQSAAALASLAVDPDFVEYKSDIYYTFWKLTGLASWKNKLSAEFPGSIEMKIASGEVNHSQSPLWLLFPGRAAVNLVPVSSAQAPAQSVTTPPAQAAQAPADTTAVDNYLQAGLFGREENAKALSERIQKAGFISIVKARVVNGSDFWAVLVPGGTDVNATIKKLKDAGFESFPVKS